MPLTTIATLATTLAQWLQIRKQRREAGSHKTIADYKEWLRRQEHADLATRLDGNRDLLAHVTQLIEDRSLAVIDSQQQLQQTIHQRLTVGVGGIVGQIHGPVTINVQSPPPRAPLPTAPEPPPPARVSTSHLPNTGPHLFGRDALLARLDDLWAEAEKRDAEKRDSHLFPSRKSGTATYFHWHLRPERVICSYAPRRTHRYPGCAAPRHAAWQQSPGRLLCR